jgi:hypothetical protein
MDEREFLNCVLQCAGRGDFREAWDSHAAWEIHAQVSIAAFLRSGYGVTNVREISYVASLEHCDFGFTISGQTYGIELKVENPVGNTFGGLPLRQAIISDVNKLHAFTASHKWFLVIARSDAAKNEIREIAERGDSWVVDEEGDFLAALCNIQTQPHYLPHMRYDKAILKDEGKKPWP